MLAENIQQSSDLGQKTGKKNPNQCPDCGKLYNEQRFAVDL
jgi:hypothetical protein